MLRIHGNKFKYLAGLSYAGLAGSGAAFLLIFAAMLFAPAASQPAASAVEDNSGISTYSTTPTVGISLPTSIDFADVLPTPSGATTTATTNLTVTTTDSAGYSLYLYSSDSDNSLKPKISSLANISKINATAGDVGLTLSSLKSNTWGYNLGTEAPTDSTTYSAVPIDNSTPIQTKDTSDTNSANDTYTLSFGAKVDTTIASGAYSDTLTIAVVAEPKKITTWDELTIMQDMTAAICATAPSDAMKRLTDSRDGKQYWVAKLADGNCWMTQNLDLDLSTNKPLTSKDSDVTDSWTPPHSTDSAGTITSADTNTETYSWDLGYFVKADPDGYSKYCGGSSVKGFSHSSCVSAGWTNVASMTPMADGTSNETISGTTYNAHYLVGNMYQWNTATAGSGGTITSAEATDSICPKGWKLPTSNNTANGSFYYLLDQYSLISSYNSTTITQFPLYFVPSGGIVSGSLWGAGDGGRYWSSTADSSSSDAYHIDFFSYDIISDYKNSRYTGFSVRCLAKGR